MPFRSTNLRRRKRGEARRESSDTRRCLACCVCLPDEASRPEEWRVVIQNTAFQSNLPLSPDTALHLLLHSTRRQKQKEEKRKKEKMTKDPWTREPGGHRDVPHRPSCSMAGSMNGGIGCSGHVRYVRAPYCEMPLQNTAEPPLQHMRTLASACSAYVSLLLGNRRIARTNARLKIHEAGWVLGGGGGGLQHF